MKTLATLVLLAACGTSDKPCDPNEPNTICTIAGSTLNEGYSGDKGPATKAVLYIPMDSAVAPNGEVWFIDFNNYVVRAIDSKGDIRTVVGNGQLGDSPASDQLTSVAALDAFNNHTPNLFFANDGYLYLAAWHESRLKRVSMSDMTMTNFAGKGVRTHYDGDGGDALMASVDLPSSVVTDPAGNLVFMDQGNQVVRMVDSSNIMHTIAGQCIVEDTPCATGSQPAACPGSDKLACGDITTECANQCTPSFAGDGGPALLARFSLPYGQQADPTGRLAYDSAGDLLISDSGNNRIRKVDAVTGVITTIAGTGDAGFSGDGGAATQAQLNHPVDLAIADDDTIYFTDVNNNCVRKIDPSGTISTVVGQCSANPNDRAFAGDGGPPLEAKLDRPYGIDLVGNKLYVSDSYNNRLRVVNLP